jgi:hypothetical protein
MIVTFPEHFFFVAQVQEEVEASEVLGPILENRFGRNWVNFWFVILT